MKNKNILIIVAIILIALYVFFVLVPNKQKVETSKREVILYFSTDNAQFLKGEKRLVATDQLYVNTINELIKGPESSFLGKTIPQATKLINLEIKNNTAVLNFNKEFKKQHWGGSTGERMTVYSLVNTMTQFSKIDMVKILITGQEVESLAGHMDLSISLSANKDLIKK